MQAVDALVNKLWQLMCDKEDAEVIDEVIHVILLPSHVTEPVRQKRL